MARRGSPAARWGRLLLGLLCVWTFMFVIAPGLRRLPVVTEALDVVREHDIDATGYLYTEVEAFGEAEFAVRESLSRNE